MELGRSKPFLDAVSRGTILYCVVRGRRLLSAQMAFAAIGFGLVMPVLYKLVLDEAGIQSSFYLTLLPGVTDFLCAGAGVAYVERERPECFTLLKVGPKKQSSFARSVASDRSLASERIRFGLDVKRMAADCCHALVMEGIDQKENCFISSVLKCCCPLCT